jgi:3-oxoacyl-[acyl-carrier protein] reductase
MDLGLHGSRALITGGGRGIGLAIAKGLRAEGASVAICGRTPETLDRAATELRAMGPGTVFAQPGDVADADALRAFTRAAIEALGGLDIIIHNATAGSGADDAAWQRSFDVDVMAGVRIVETAEDALEASDRAAVLFIGSTAADQLIGRGTSSYGPAKSAQRVIVNELGHALGPKGVRVNVLSPGPTTFPGSSWERRRKRNPSCVRNFERAQPFGRVGTADEVARVAVFLVSPAASWMNATNVIVDGGTFPARGAASIPDQLGQAVRQCRDRAVGAARRFARAGGRG